MYNNTCQFSFYIILICGMSVENNNKNVITRRGSVHAEMPQAILMHVTWSYFDNRTAKSHAPPVYWKQNLKLTKHTPYLIQRIFFICSAGINSLNLQKYNLNYSANLTKKVNSTKCCICMSKCNFSLCSC